MKNKMQGLKNMIGNLIEYFGEAVEWKIARRIRKRGYKITNFPMNKNDLWGIISYLSDESRTLEGYPFFKLMKEPKLMKAENQRFAGHCMHFGDLCFLDNSSKMKLNVFGRKYLLEAEELGKYLSKKYRMPVHVNLEDECSHFVNSFSGVEHRQKD
jgi:hypothetical protein